jgi:hypothetical protein
MKAPKTLYQVHVTDTEAGHDIPIGPAMDSPDPLYGLAEQTNLAILKGKITGWKEAHVVSFAKQ